MNAKIRLSIPVEIELDGEFTPEEFLAAFRRHWDEWDDGRYNFDVEAAKHHLASVCKSAATIMAYHHEERRGTMNRMITMAAPGGFRSVSVGGKNVDFRMKSFRVRLPEFSEEDPEYNERGD